ncbi:MAG: DHHW family protein [Lachnospiraceae bacterium]
MTQRLFVLILFLGLLGSLLAPDKRFSAYENRYLAEVPNASITSVMNGTYTAALDTYVNDHMILRNPWIRTKTLCDKYILGKQVINDVYLGNDDYLIARYTQKDIDTTQLEKNISYLEAFCKKQKTDVILIPTASEVLTNHLPQAHYQLDQSALLSDVSVSLDATALLRTHKEEEIFYHTDHHWTLLGAYYVYAHYVKQPIPYEALPICDDFFGTNYKKVNLPVEPDTMYAIQSPHHFLVTYDEAITADSLYEPAYLTGSDQYSYYLDGNHGLTQITNLSMDGDADTDSILIIKDSFANTFATLLCNNYRNVYLIDLRYYNKSVADFIREHSISNTLFLYNNINFMQDRNLAKLL